MFEIGDLVKAYNGHTGMSINNKILAVSAKSTNFQQTLVKFLNCSTINGLSEDFQAVFEKLFAQIMPTFVAKFELLMTSKY